MDDKRKDVFSILLIEIEKAERKHPEYPAEPEKALSIITEEFLELSRAVNDGEKKQRLIEEAAHVAVTAFRFIEKNI
jgi:NTP pyrophosphatase (non-canonical NTP hydrolase)